MELIKNALGEIRHFCETASQISIYFDRNEPGAVVLKRILLKQIEKYEEYLLGIQKPFANGQSNFVTFDELDEVLEDLRAEIDKTEF